MHFWVCAPHEALSLDIASSTTRPHQHKLLYLRLACLVVVGALLVLIFLEIDKVWLFQVIFGKVFQQREWTVRQIHVPGCFPASSNAVAARVWEPLGNDNGSGKLPPLQERS